jgi:hypothetical protein
MVCSPQVLFPGMIGLFFLYAQQVQADPIGRQLV